MMQNAPQGVSAELLVSLIKSLNKQYPYSYINDSTQTVVAIDSIDSPAGPITIRRWNPGKEETYEQAKPQSISKQMLTRVANAIEKGMPVNMDRLLGASYNTRSALEALLCHTPPFYYCYPGRIDFSTGKAKIKDGHKHIVYLPNTPHAAGELEETKLENMAINEVPAKNVVYNALELPSTIPAGKISTTEERIHLQMQMAIYEIGNALGVNTYIAQNDQGCKYKGKLLSEQEGIITNLKEVPIIGPIDGAVKAGKMIDAIWITSRSIPAVFEVENSTGVTPGLTRMLNFHDCLPLYQDMRYIIVAPENTRSKVINEVNKPEFASLQAYFMPYDSVSELLGLCQERTLKGITVAFLETFLDTVIIK